MCQNVVHRLRTREDQREAVHCRNTFILLVRSRSCELFPQFSSLTRYPPRSIEVRWALMPAGTRSEERRVGKECRAGVSPGADTIKDQRRGVMVQADDI